MMMMVMIFHVCDVVGCSRLVTAWRAERCGLRTCARRRTLGAWVGAQGFRPVHRPNWPRRSAAYSPARCGESHRCRRICPSVPRNTRRDHEGADPHDDDDDDDDETNRTSQAAGGGSQTMQTHQMQKEPQADPECKLSRQMFHLGVSAPNHAG